MNLIVRVFGHEVLAISNDAEPEVEYDEPLHDGGTLGYDRIDAGDTDRYMGFTNGRAE